MADGNSVQHLNPFDEVRDLCQRLTAEVGRRVVGQQEAVAGLTAGLLTGGNVLMEGVPGIGKTLLAKSLSDAVHLHFSRIQFTPDLMPADILGTHMVHIDADGRPQMSLQKGPLFANVILADEINRASPRTQAALLEAMQERQVSLGTETYKLDSPYFVVATQNPIDQEGTYPLPEAQLDRFLMKLLIRFPTEEEVLEIVARTTGTEDAEIRPIANADEIVAAGKTIRQVPVADFIARYAVSLVFASHPETPKAPAAVRRYVKCGASPRAAQSVILVAKFFALLDGRMNVAVDDIQRAAFPCLRHRILINFDGIADDATSDSLIEQILHEIPRPKGK